MTIVDPRTAASPVTNDWTTRDYIEIEIIDPELTPGWNLERGERKVIYLKEN